MAAWFTVAAATAAVAVGGAAAVALRTVRLRRALALADYLALDDAEPRPPAVGEGAASFADRVLRPLVRAAGRRIAGVTPGAHLDGIHRELLKAGLAAKVRAEEFVAVEVASVAACSVLAVAFAAVGRPPARLVVAMIVLLPLIGVLLPRSWLARRVRERQDRLKRDLPEVLDLLSLSVQAGLGFEAAMALVVDRLPSPLAGELGLVLREMELGRSRREAFTNLKRRTDVLELHAFVSAIVQADALGVPIGRLLSTQAAEMRLRRRQWAQERANALPVKMLFPLLLLIFPAIFVVLLGPAVGPLRDLFD